MPQDVRDLLSSKKCSKCGGPSGGWICSACGYTAEHFDPMHWKDCNRGGKMVVKCKACGLAENKCTCPPVK